LRAATKLVPERAILETFELDGIPGFNQDEEQNPRVYENCSFAFLAVNISAEKLKLGTL
jgi:hypothetical protein